LRRWSDDAAPGTFWGIGWKISPRLHRRRRLIFVTSKLAAARLVTRIVFLIPPFPLATALDQGAADPIATTAPLTLYRVLIGGTADAGNVLRAMKQAGLVEIRY